MSDIAKRVLSAEMVACMANNVVISRRFRDDTEFEAVQFSSDGNCVKGWWDPARDWDYPTDIREGESGTFTPAE